MLKLLFSVRVRTLSQIFKMFEFMLQLLRIAGIEQRIHISKYSLMLFKIGLLGLLRRGQNSNTLQSLKPSIANN